MSIADELRRDADAALNEGGMYYSGEYLDGIAKRVEEVEAENAKLRELLFSACMHMATRQMVIANSSDQWGCGRCCLEQLDGLRDATRELGIEVE